MLVMVRCVIFDGHRAPADTGNATARITRVREGQVLSAWRSVEGRIGVALLNVPSMGMISTLLNEAFPNARHIDVDEVLAVEAVEAPGQQQKQPPAAGESRKTGT